MDSVSPSPFPSVLFPGRHGVGATGPTPRRTLKRFAQNVNVSYVAPVRSVIVAPHFIKNVTLNAIPPMFPPPIQINLCETSQLNRCLKPCLNIRDMTMSPLSRRSLKRSAAVGLDHHTMIEPLTDSIIVGRDHHAKISRKSMTEPLTRGPVIVRRDHHAKNFNSSVTAPPLRGPVIVGRGHHAKIGLARPLGVTTAPRSDVVSIMNPLAQCLPKWKECNVHPWVINTIENGYKLQFASTPPTFERVIFSHASGQAANILQTEILSLLSKNAIREVPLNQSLNGFYSRYFLVKKKGGGVRPILDLRALNRYLKVFRFKMLTNAALLRMMRTGDWYTSLDLKDAYFHIPIYAPHRKFLRFGFRGRVYEYLVLPFGMSLSPRVFVKCTQAAVAPLRQNGIRIASYIDDWLICAGTEIEAQQHTNMVLSHVTSLGFSVNYTKSVLAPARSIDFIGMTLNSTSFTARLSQDRVNSTMACAASFRVGRRVSFRTCQRMAGLMASATTVLRLGRLYMRPFQRWMRSLGIPNTQRHRTVTANAACTAALQRWRDRYFLSEGVTMGLVVSRKIITTDASLTGWGATHEGRAAQGVWDSNLRSTHINYLELMAVLLALQHFRTFIQGCHVLVRTDNTTTMCYINKQGGLRSRSLHALAQELTLWCDVHLRSIRASHVPGILNKGADLLSRGKCHYAEWSLHDAVATQLWDRFGQPLVDLFASEENAKCPRFFSMTGQGSLGLDALAHDWPEGLLYAFPPLSLIPPVLERVRTQGLSVILIAPGWGSWRSEITPLLYDRPWKLPLRRDLLTQAGGEIFHPRPGDLDLWAWPVSG